MAKIDGNTAALNIKFYSFSRRGNIAPLGPYQQIELSYLRYTLTDIDRRFYPNGRPNLGTYEDFAFSLTFGLRHIYFDRLSLDVGMQYAFILGVLDDSGNSQEALAIRLSRNRLRGHFGLNYHMGIGILIF